MVEFWTTLQIERLDGWQPNVPIVSDRPQQCQLCNVLQVSGEVEGILRGSASACQILRLAGKYARLQDDASTE